MICAMKTITIACATLLLVSAAAAQDSPEHKYRLFIDCVVSYARAHHVAYEAIAMCSEAGVALHDAVYEAELGRLRETYSELEAEARATSKADRVFADAIKEAKAEAIRTSH